MIILFKGGVLHFRQPYVRSTGLLYEPPHTFRPAASSSNSAEHKATPKSSWITSLEDADIALSQALEDWGRGLSCWGLLTGSLSRDLDLVNSLGGEKERERDESWRGGDFILSGLLQDLKISLLGGGGWNFSNEGDDRGAGRGYCVEGCCCLTSGADCCDSVGMLVCVHCFFRFGRPTVSLPL